MWRVEHDPSLRKATPVTPNIDISPLLAVQTQAREAAADFGRTEPVEVAPGQWNMRLLRLDGDKVIDRLPLRSDSRADVLGFADQLLRIAQQGLSLGKSVEVWHAAKAAHKAELAKPRTAAALTFSGVLARETRKALAELKPARSAGIER